MTVGLPVSRLINVSVNLSPQLAVAPNFNTCLVLGTSDVIDVNTRMREYGTIGAVAADFGTTAEEYLAALEWFSQVPSPATLLIGRWANAATVGQLYGGALDAADLLIGPWAAINNGAFAITIDGVGPQQVGGLDFTAQVNLNGVAAQITAGLPGGTAVCTWDAEFERFVISSVATGAAAIISFLTAPAAGTDISGMLKMLQTSSGAYQADGVAAQTALETVVLFDNKFSSQFYGLVIPSASDNDHVAVAEYIEAAAQDHFYGVNTMEAGVISATSTTDIAYVLSQIAGLNHTAVQYSSTSAYAIMSLLARILTTDWTANNSTITLMYKQEPGITAEALNETQMDALLAKNCNVFVDYNNDTAIIEPGASSSGQFIDSVIGTDWLRAALQNAGFNVLYGTTTKVPQTDAGMHQLATAFEAVLSQAVSNGLLAPGTWTSQGFGNLKPGDYVPKGFYVYAPPVSTQSAADRRQRKSVPFQIAALLGGAVHTVDVAVTVQS